MRAASSADFNATSDCNGTALDETPVKTCYITLCPPSRTGMDKRDILISSERTHEINISAGGSAEKDDKLGEEIEIQAHERSYDSPKYSSTNAFFLRPSRNCSISSCVGIFGGRTFSGDRNGMYSVAARAWARATSSGDEPFVAPFPF